MVWIQATDNMNAFMTADTKKTNVERIEVLHDTEFIISTYMQQCDRRYTTEAICIRNPVEQGNAS